jgi:hypothetical protein
MHTVYILAFVTFGLVLAFLAWNMISMRRHQATGGGKTSGIGGKADPMSGTTSGMRDPEEMRQALNAQETSAESAGPVRQAR